MIMYNQTQDNNLNKINHKTFKANIPTFQGNHLPLNHIHQNPIIGIESPDPNLN